MSQPTLFDDLNAAFAQGVESAERCQDAAESRGWDAEGAASFIVAYLAEHGPTAGEVLVTEASKRFTPHDARAFGGVFLRLSRRGRIRKCGSVLRRKGHGTSGGNVWTLVIASEAA